MPMKSGATSSSKLASVRSAANACSRFASDARALPLSRRRRRCALTSRRSLQDFPRACSGSSIRCTKSTFQFSSWTFHADFPSSRQRNGANAGTSERPLHSTTLQDGRLCKANKGTFLHKACLACCSLDPLPLQTTRRTRSWDSQHSICCRPPPAWRPAFCPAVSGNLAHNHP